MDGRNQPTIYLLEFETAKPLPSDSTLQHSLRPLLQMVSRQESEPVLLLEDQPRSTPVMAATHFLMAPH